MVLISAHMGGGEAARPGSYEAYQHALSSGAEYAELDIRKTRDNVLVCYHDEHAGRGGPPVAALSWAELCERAGYQVPRVAEVMRLLGGKLLGHLDLKETGYEKEVIELALASFGPGQFVATTLEDVSVAAIKQAYPDVPAALSLGRETPGWPGAPVGRGAGQRGVAAAPDPGLRRGLDRGAPPAGPGRGGRGVPPARHRGHGLDRRRRRADRPVPGQPDGGRADHQPAGVCRFAAGAADGGGLPALSGHVGAPTPGRATGVMSPG